MNIKFISYDGRWPNLCSGILKVEIDGIVYTFGDYDNRERDYYFDRFWTSGGKAGIDRNGDDYCIKGRWEICTGSWLKLPDNFEELSEDLINCFNDNVRQGCCGGCI